MAGLAIGSPCAAEQAPVPIPRWNPKAPENNQLVPAFNYGAMETVIGAIGARSQRTGTNPARPTLLVTFANGRRATIALTGCDVGGTACKALSILSVWNKIAASSDQTALAISGFNQRYAYAKAFVAVDGRPVLQRYLTADYGFVRGDLAVNLQVFADQAQRFAIEVLRPLARK
jgi:hypothetical protein